MAFHVWKKALGCTTFHPHWKAFFNPKAPLLAQKHDALRLTLHLERDGVLAKDERIGGFSLDELCQLFGVIPHDRHTAAGDAFITAQVFQRLLPLARRAGRVTVGRLGERFPLSDQG